MKSGICMKSEEINLLAMKLGNNGIEKRSLRRILCTSKKPQLILLTQSRPEYTGT